MNLFSAPLDRVTEADVRDFLGLDLQDSKRLPEGQRLDFNTSIPDDIGTDVASFANTYGGVILIGVQADKNKQNIPVSLIGLPPGPDLETQVRSRIDATVRPRPAVEVKSVATSNGSYLVIVRVAKGNYPPYEYQKGDRTSIPLRTGDRKRPANLREIETLIRERAAASDFQTNLRRYIESSGFAPLVSQTINGQIGEAIDSDFHKIFLVPRARGELRLDSKFERDFDILVRACFPEQQSKSVHYRTGEHFQIEARCDGPLRRWHHLWRVHRSGALQFAAGFTGDPPEGKPIGDLAYDLISMCMLGSAFFARAGIVGDIDLDHQVLAPKAELLPCFPPPNGIGSYDQIRGFISPQGRLFNTTGSHMACTVDTSELTALDEKIADMLVYCLRELKGIGVNYDYFFEAVKELGQRIRTRPARPGLTANNIR